MRKRSVCACKWSSACAGTEVSAGGRNIGHSYGPGQVPAAGGVV